MPRIQHKRGTSANLASVNPTPLAGELVWDSTENAIKIGDGATAWTSLAYVTATPRTHDHDDRYYTETEIDGLLAAKSDTSHNHGLSSLSDVSAAAPISDKAFLIYSSSLSQWVASTGIGQVGVGSQPLGGWPSGSLGENLQNLFLSYLDLDSSKVGTGDSRLSDARTPTAHKASHATGGSDALTPADIGAAALSGASFTGTVSLPLGSNSAPSLYFSTFSDTGFYRPAENAVGVTCAGAERMVWRGTGIFVTTPAFVVGATSSRSAGPAVHPVFQFEGTTAGAVSYQCIAGSTTATVSPQIILARHRGAVGQSTAVISGDSLGLIRFNGGDGTDCVSTGAQIECRVDGDPGSNDMPGRLTFSTTADGAATSTERMRITSAGLVGIATTAPSATLDVNADTMRLRTARTPASATATGNAGDICWDSSYLYVCTATNTWRRIAHSTW